MRPSVRELAVGAGAALSTPLWLHGRRWRTLLAAPEQATAPSAATLAGAEGAIRAGRFWLRQLARIPGGVWRNTCLFRSVAECLVLRRRGVDARLRIGVGREADGIIAHAWVQRPGQPDADADPRAAELRILDGSA
jgi:hypothetical protein